MSALSTPTRPPYFYDEPEDVPVEATEALRAMAAEDEYCRVCGGEPIGACVCPRPAAGETRTVTMTPEQWRAVEMHYADMAEEAEADAEANAGNGDHPMAALDRADVVHFRAILAAVKGVPT